MSQGELSFRSRSERQSDPEGPTVLSVSQVVRGANRLLEGRFGVIWVEGEIGSLSITSSGHAFFTLKDDWSVLPVAMWRTSLERLRFELADGQFLRACGKLGIFAKQGKFQLYADRAEPAGLGALMLELEQRKAKLAAEGLFAADRKRPLPRWPRAIGVVTSRTGAAIHDVLRVARHRRPSRVVLAPAVVQGPEAPRALVRGLRRVSELPGIDVVIIGRGGGSAEDLWAFNDERLARAIADCPVPVVSAVGHEVDVTICDLVADVRAATPSQAAELVVPDADAITQRLDQLTRRLFRAVERSCLDERSRLDQARGRLSAEARRVSARSRARLAELEAKLRRAHPRSRINADRRQLERLRAEVERHWRQRSREPKLRLARAVAALNALSPLAVLERGYSVVQAPDGRVITNAADVRPGDELDVRLHRGTLQVEVKESDD